MLKRNFTKQTGRMTKGNFRAAYEVDKAGMWLGGSAGFDSQCSRAADGRI
jgi:hypothetical protein